MDKDEQIKALQAEVERLTTWAEAATYGWKREADVTAAWKLRAEAAEAKVESYRSALESISKNSCCDTCQEAKLVALQALAAGEAQHVQR